MAIYKNTPPIVTNGLVLALDAANPKSYIGDRNILNPYTWTVSSGSIGLFNRNGVVSENIRAYGTDPFGKSSVLWSTYPVVNNGEDGGWNTSDIPINPTQMYRFSVWVKRTSSSSTGNFYLGVYGKNNVGSNMGVIRMDNGAIQTNAYWDCPNIGVFTQNVWYLVVGHIYPENTTYTGRNPDTGVYTIAGGKVRDVNGCNIGTGDVRWQSGSVYTNHRVYHYYATDATSQLQFFDPRIDLCDGTQPSINGLLTDKPRTWYSMLNTTITGSMVGIGFNSNKKCLLFTSSSNSTCVFNNSDLLNFNTGSFSIETLVRLTSPAIGTVNSLFIKRSGTGGIGSVKGFGYRVLANTATNASVLISVDNGTGANNGDYTIIPGSINFPYYTTIHSVLIFNASTLKLSEYRNGVLVTPESTNTGVMTGSFYNNTQNLVLGKNDGNSLDAEYYFFRAYNRVLSSTEVLQNYNATKGRFGL
jgi:hypothetical protein